MSKSFIEQVHYIRIPVKDLEQSAQWYRDVLGIQLLNITDDPFAIFKVNEGAFLLILVPTDDETFAHFTINNESAFSIGFTSPELTEFSQHLINKQVKVEDIQEDNGHSYFHFYDPNGNKLPSKRVGKNFLIALTGAFLKLNCFFFLITCLGWLKIMNKHKYKVNSI